MPGLLRTLFVPLNACMAACSAGCLAPARFAAWLAALTPSLQGEELRKVIGASAYIECSSKTQQVSGADLQLI